jgi:hypothetical protein
MLRVSTNQAARKLGLHPDTLAHYIAVGRVPTPEIISVGTGKRVVHAWSEEDIERVRQLLPKIANGRKTRYKKNQSAIGNKQLAKAKPKTKSKARKRPKP